MAWRVVDHAERRWNSPQWNLVFSFRTADPGQRSVWGTYPISSSSKAALFAQAERVSNDDLVTLLSQLLG
jgi:hypothetical protein